MRIKVNHLSLGLFPETVIVCREKEEKYFRQVAGLLENTHSVKTEVFVYDRDEMTKKIKRHLALCYTVIFMLTEGETEAAFADPEHPLRKTYAFVEKYNPYSLSLAAVDGCTVNYSEEYPSDMKSFAWLHRKNLFVSRQFPEQIARILHTELREHYHRREKKKLARLNEGGIEGFRDIAEFLRGKFLKYFIATLIGALLFFLCSLGAERQLGFLSSTAFSVISLLGSMGLLIGSLGFSIYSLMRGVYLRDRVLDVSTVFADFKKATVIRLCILLGLAIAGYSGWILYLLTQHAFETAFSGLVLFGCIALLQLLIFLHNVLILKAPTNNYLIFAKRRFFLNLGSVPVYYLFLWGMTQLMLLFAN